MFRSIGKVMAWTLAFSVVVWVLFLAFLPSIVSMDFAREAIVNNINEKINGRVAIDRINVSWFGQQVIEGIKISDAEDRQIVSLDRIGSTQGIISAMLFGEQWDRVNIENLNADLYSTKGVNNLQLALAPLKQEKLAIGPGENVVQIIGASLTTQDRAVLEGKTLYQGKNGQFKFELSTAQENRSIVGQAENIPTALIDQIATMRSRRFQGLAPLLLGQMVNFAIDERSLGAQDVVNVQIKSQKLNTVVTASVDHEKVVLLKPIDADISLTPEAFSRLAVLHPALKGLSIDRPVDLVVSISELFWPIGGHDIAQLSISGVLDISKTTLQGVPHLGALEISGIQAALRGPAGAATLEVSALIKGDHQGTPLEAEMKAVVDKPASSDAFFQSVLENAKFNIKALHFPLSLVDTVSGLPFALGDWFGPFIDLTLDGQVDNGTGVAHLDVTSDNIRTQNIDFLIDDRFVLKKPAEISYTLPKAMINSWLFTEVEIGLKNDVEFKLRVDSFAINLKDLQSSDNILSATELRTSVELQTPAALDFPGQLGELVVDTVRIAAIGSPLSNTQCQLEIGVHPAANEGFFEELLGAQASLSAQGNIALGPGISVSNLSVNGHSAQGTFHVRSDWNENGIALAAPAEVQYRLTPDVFNQLGVVDGDYLALADDSTVSFSLAPLFSEPERSGFHAVNLSGQLSVDGVALAIKNSNEVITLQDFVIPWEIDGAHETLRLSFSGKTQYGQEEGTVRGKLTLTDWLQGDVLTFNESRIKAKVNIVDFPTRLLSLLSGYQLLIPFVGDHINLDLDTEVLSSDYSGHLELALSSEHLDASLEMKQMPGPVIARATGKHITAEMRSYVDGGILTLSEPVVARVQATPALGRYVLQDIVPVLGSLHSSDKPITVTIYPEGTGIPLFSGEIAALNLPNATVDMGVMNFRNEGQLAVLMSLLGQTMEPMVSVWVTPLYFHIQQGVLQVDRVDFLVNQRFPFAAWGVVDFVREQVNMIIGMRGLALANAFNIKKVDKDFMVQIPLRGPLDDPQIEKKKTAARIAALVAQSKGTEGLLVGTFIELASGGFKDQQVPPPTTNPLPWSEGEAQAMEKKNSEKVPASLIEEAARKEIQKGAKKLFDKWFGN